jgi:hypothetical protein
MFQLPLFVAVIPGFDRMFQTLQMLKTCESMGGRKMGQDTDWSDVFEG